MRGDGGLTLKSEVVRGDGYLAGTIDGCTILLNAEHGEYHQLNEVGTRIWELIAAPMAIDALIDKLLDHFDGTRMECEADVFAFLEGLRARQLLQVVETSSG